MKKRNITKQNHRGVRPALPASRCLAGDCKSPRRARPTADALLSLQETYLGKTWSHKVPSSEAAKRPPRSVSGISSLVHMHRY